MAVILNKNIKSRILNGHPWIYENEIDIIKGEYKPGDIVNVMHGKKFIGKGYYNPASLITVRLLTRKEEEINPAFFEKKIKKAVKYRKEMFGDSDTYRVVFGEADGLPGLIIDKFSEYISIQINTLGIYKWRNEIIDILIKEFNPKGIFEKDDEKSTAKEGFPYTEGWIYKNGPELIPFDLNGIRFFADTLGQKTGFFLDQRQNALFNVKYSENKEVLDAFTYTGNFGMHSLKGKAKHVTFMDYSERALHVLGEVLKANNIEKGRYEIINGNSFDILRKFDEDGRKFDLTIIDPPSMSKARETKRNAERGYKELNLRAMKITKEAGYLSTSSCTQIIYDEEFKSIIYSAAEDSKKVIKMIYKGMQSHDHPDVMNILETQYLKHYLFRLENLKEF